MPEAAPAPTSKEVYLRLLGHVRPYWKLFVLALIAMIGMAATEPLFPALMKPLLDKGFSGASRDDLYLAPLAIIAIFVVRGVLGYFASYAFAWVSNRVIADLRRAMFERLIHLPARYHLANSSSTPVTKIAYDVAGVASMATTVLTVAVRDTLVVIGLTSWLLYLNWQLTLVSLAIIPLAGLVMRSFSNRLRSLSRAAQLGMATMNQTLLESIHCQKVCEGVRRRGAGAGPLRQAEQRAARLCHASGDRRRRHGADRADPGGHRAGHRGLDRPVPVAGPPPPRSAASCPSSPPC